MYTDSNTPVKTSITGITLPRIAPKRTPVSTETVVVTVGGNKVAVADTLTETVEVTELGVVASTVTCTVVLDTGLVGPAVDVCASVGPSAVVGAVSVGQGG
jgi:hypothetical protein